MKKTCIAFIVSLFLITGSRAIDPDPLFPEIDGWNLKVEDMVYTPDNLWELINGAADVFLIYGFQDLHIGEYTGSENSSVRVELYRHSNANNSFGIYASERMPDYQYFETGTEGYTSFGVLNFLAGVYYIKMFWTGTGEADEAAMKVIAGKVDVNLLQKTGWPEELSLFPVENRIEKSEGFSSENFLGYSFLHNAFTAAYKSNGIEYKMFLINQKSADAAKTTIERYFKISGYHCPEAEEKFYIVSDTYNGKIGIGLLGSYIYGVMQVEDDKIIEENLLRLKTKIVQE